MPVNPALPLSFVFGFLVFEACRHVFAGTGWRLNSSRRVGFERKQSAWCGRRDDPPQKTAPGLTPSGRRDCARNIFRSNSSEVFKYQQEVGLGNRARGLKECGLRSRLLRISLKAMQ